MYRSNVGLRSIHGSVSDGLLKIISIMQLPFSKRVLNNVFKLSSFENTIKIESYTFCFELKRVLNQFTSSFHVKDLHEC